jgi:hypothetical protein
MNFGPAGEGTDIKVKPLWGGGRVFSQALRNPMGVEFPSKYALLLLTKKSILYSILRTQHTLERTGNLHDLQYLRGILHEFDFSAEKWKYQLYYYLIIILPKKEDCTTISQSLYSTENKGLCSKDSCRSVITAANTVWCLRKL